jgi:hypothetical protein
MGFQRRRSNNELIEKHQKIANTMMRILIRGVGVRGRAWNKMQKIMNSHIIELR